MAVVRVKRHRDDAPIDTMLLACKRRKTEGENLTSVFKFAATVSDQKENVSEHILKASNKKESFKTPNLTNITDKLRAENKLFSQNNRFKVVSWFRGASEGEGEGGAAVALTVVDIEASSQPPIEETGDKYVYDLYYSANCELDEKTIEDPISWHALDYLEFEDYSKTTYDVEEESDDSNDENNWRNDYPDEDPDSIGEEDIKIACGIGSLKLSEDEGGLLSSEEEWERGEWAYDDYKRRCQQTLFHSQSESESDSDLESEPT